MSTGDRYNLIRKIGIGGMAEVWKAKALGSAGFEKTVAIKKVLPALAKDPEFVERFITEAKLVAGLVHPNIIQVFDFGELEPGVYFLAMEYLPGPDLQSLLLASQKEGRLLPPEVSIHVGMEVAKALGYAHSRSPAIIHRDISPHNILVSFDGEAKVADFGIAKVSGTSTIAGTVKGKIGYLSPEQARGKAIDHRTDLFSLGVTLYRLLTGTDLFSGKTEAERYASVASYQGAEGPRLERVPKIVRHVIARTLRVYPQDRYQDAGELEADLGACLDMSSTVAMRRALASLVQSHFPDEHAAEATEGTSPGTVTESQPTLNMPSSSKVTELTPSPKPAAKKRNSLALIGAGLLLIGLTIAGAVFGPRFLGGGGNSTPTSVAVVSPAPTPTPTPTLTPSPELSVSPSPIAAETVNTPRRTPRRTPTARPTKPKITRKIPTHAVTLLDGCSAGDIATTRTEIGSAIRLGAPLYNGGNVAACYALYRQAAQNIKKKLPAGCAGPKKALDAGLTRAAGFRTPEEQAWAMRDAFDGLINVIGRKRKPDKNQ